MSRRGFLAACATLAVGATACGGLRRASRSAYVLLHDPGPEEYRGVLRALVESILPFEHPRFPHLSVGEMEARLWSLFDLEGEERLLALQKGLLLFDDVALFAHAAGPVVDAEWRAQDGARRPASSSAASMAREKLSHDRTLLDGFRAAFPGGEPWRGRGLEARRDYLRLWSASAFVVRRQFYRSAKSLVLVSAYSHPALWDAIGYDGITLGRIRA